MDSCIFLFVLGIILAWSPLFWCTCVGVQFVASDCLGHWSVKVHLVSTIGIVGVLKVRYVWMEPTDELSLKGRWERMENE